MTNQGDRLQVRLVLDYNGKDSHRALEKWIPDALDRYFNADQPGQMYVDEISVEPAEPVPPVPEVTVPTGPSMQGVYEALRRNPTGARTPSGHEITCSSLHGGDCTCAPAERPAEGTEDVEAEVGRLLDDFGNAAFEAGRGYGAMGVGSYPSLPFGWAKRDLVSLVQRQRAEAVEEYATRVHDGCPCTVIEPCMKQCTCGWGGYSAGCRRCAKYGSPEQRVHAARRIAEALT